MDSVSLSARKGRLWILILCLVLFVEPGGGLARAEDVGVSESTENSFKPERRIKVSVVPDSRQLKDVEKVRWNDDKNHVITRYFGTSSDSTLLLQGTIKKDNAAKWHLIWNEKSFDVKPDGQFSVDLPYSSQFKSLELVLVGPKGEVEYHFYQLKIELPSVPSEEGKDVLKPDSADLEFNQKLKRRFFVSPGLGISSISYTQTGVESYRSAVMTAKVASNYLLLPPKWDLGFSGFFNFVSLTKSSPVDIRFLGLNLRLGYIFPEIKSPWRLSLYGGWYYSTMFASDSSFGYKNISGPQLFPSLRRNLNNGHAIGTYLKFSPINNNFGFLSLANNEIATGISYLIPTGKNTFSISLDYARISFSDEEVAISSRSISLGGSMTF